MVFCAALLVLLALLQLGSAAPAGAGGGAAALRRSARRLARLQPVGALALAPESAPAPGPSQRPTCPYPGIGADWFLVATAQVILGSDSAQPTLCRSAALPQKAGSTLPPSPRWQPASALDAPLHLPPCTRGPPQRQVAPIALAGSGATLSHAEVASAAGQGLLRALRVPGDAYGDYLPGTFVIAFQVPVSGCTGRGGNLRLGAVGAAGAA